jgi:hypothetical protein
MLINAAAIVIFYSSYYSGFILHWYYKAGLIIVLCGAVLYISELYKSFKILSKSKPAQTKPAEAKPEAEKSVIENIHPEIPDSEI